MARIITRDLEQITGGQYDKFMLGIKPSGPLHLGTTLVLLHGIMALSSSEATLDATVMTHDFDFQRGKDFVSFEGLPDPFGCHDLMKEHTYDEISQVVDEMCDFFSVSRERVNVRNFGDYTELQEFQEIITHLIGNQRGRRVLRQTIGPSRQRARYFVSPICSCMHSSTDPPSIVHGDNIILRTDCHNHKCHVDEFQVGLTEPRKVNFFYLLDPVRDLLSEGEGIHIYGGDYGLKYGVDGRSKALRVLQLFEELSGNAPDVYVGPLLNHYGRKLGKSKSNAYTIANLRQNNEEWVRGLFGLVVENTQEIIDYDILERYFGVCDQE